MKSALLVIAFLLVAGTIYKAWRGQCRFNKRMKDSNFTVDFTKKV